MKIVRAIRNIQIKLVLFLYGKVPVLTKVMISSEDGICFYKLCWVRKNAIVDNEIYIVSKYHLFFEFTAGIILRYPILTYRRYLREPLRITR